MTRTEKLDAIATKIKAAADLWDLHKFLIEFESVTDDDGYLGDERPGELELAERGIDICWLPTFGGEQPKSTAEIWSYDEDHVLAGVGPFADWEIRERR